MKQSQCKYTFSIDQHIVLIPKCVLSVFTAFFLPHTFCRFDIYRTRGAFNKHVDNKHMLDGLHMCLQHDTLAPSRLWHKYLFSSYENTSVTLPSVPNVTLTYLED